MVVRIIGKFFSSVILSVVLVSTPVFLSKSEAEANEQTETKKHINPSKALQQCRLKKDDKERLSCFDELARRFAPPTYKGRLGTVTDNFTLKEPHLLRYRSQGVIFVLYLRDKEGNVLQNFHIGGGGEKDYLIKKPGIYSLKIHGSASWEIWLDPIKN